MRGRLRIIAVQTEGSWSWHAALVTADGTELDRSPDGTEHQAELYLNNYRRCGAWEKS